MDDFDRMGQELASAMRDYMDAQRRLADAQAAHAGLVDEDPEDESP